MIKGDFFKYVIPVPPDLHIVAGSVGPADSPDQMALEAQGQANLKKYGYRDWYDFCTSVWGTKWDVDCEGQVEVSEDGLTIEASFESAWSPPVGVYRELLAQGFTVTALYYEPGMCYVGKWQDGEDQCYEYNHFSSLEVRDVIGEELDDQFGISESLAEYEAEETQDE
jgi:hypothetical protein